MSKIMMYANKNRRIKRAKTMCFCLMLICVLPLTGCEVTFKTRDFYNSKSATKQRTSQKSQNSKSLTKPIQKNKLKTRSLKPNSEASVSSKILSLLGLKSDNASKKAQTQASLKNTSNLSSLSWAWPVKSTKDNHISLKKAPEGMVFLGKPTTSVLASAKGIVTYSGSGLKDYGNLIIIKHTNELLSVYANNQKLVVKEGDIVSQGQEIAKMGDSGKMHFEIRQNGKSLDPLKLLPNKMK